MGFGLSGLKYPGLTIPISHVNRYSMISLYFWILFSFSFPDFYFCFNETYSSDTGPKKTVTAIPSRFSSIITKQPCHVLLINILGLTRFQKKCDDWWWSDCTASYLKHLFPHRMLVVTPLVQMAVPANPDLQESDIGVYVLLVLPVKTVRKVRDGLDYKILCYFIDTNFQGIFEGRAVAAKDCCHDPFIC